MSKKIVLCTCSSSNIFSMDLGFASKLSCFTTVTFARDNIRVRSSTVYKIESLKITAMLRNVIRKTGKNSISNELVYLELAFRIKRLIRQNFVVKSFDFPTSLFETFTFLGFFKPMLVLRDGIDISDQLFVATNFRH